MNLREAFELLIDTGRCERVVDMTVAQTEDTVTKIVGTGSKADLVDYPREKPNRNHTFATLDGFVSFLTSDQVHADPKGIVFVGHEAVADLAYGKHRMDQAVLELRPSTELDALANLFDVGYTQRDLWTLLIGDLAGCFDDSLLLAISQLKMTKTSEAATTIQATGIEDDGGAMKMIVGCGENQVAVPVDWVFTGRAFECWDLEFTLDLRLEVTVDGGIGFRFHPRRFTQWKNACRLDLVREIAERLANKFDVHEGTL